MSTASERHAAACAAHEEAIVAFDAATALEGAAKVAWVRAEKDTAEALHVTGVTGPQAATARRRYLAAIDDTEAAFAHLTATTDAKHAAYRAWFSGGI